MLSTLRTSRLQRSVTKQCSPLSYQTAFCRRQGEYSSKNDEKLTPLFAGVYANKQVVVKVIFIVRWWTH